MRQNMANGDFSDILPEDLAEKVKRKALKSMGVDISEADIANIKGLCDQILQNSTRRSQLSDYLEEDMSVLAPNLCALLGELTNSTQPEAREGTFFILLSDKLFTAFLRSVDSRLRNQVLTSRRKRKIALCNIWKRMQFCSNS